MTKFGVHALVFTDTWTEAAATRACSAAREIGFDLVEVLVFDPATLDMAMTKRVARSAGVDLRLGMALPADADISSTDPAMAARGEATVTRCLEIAAELGAPAVSGITYAAFNSYAAPPTDAQRDQVIAALARLDARAGALGVRLGIEPVNRYESYMVNTLDQGAAMIRAAGAHNMFLHMDTFHMNIEEVDMCAAIRKVGKRLVDVHVADNNRLAPGMGNLDWQCLVGTLREIGYDGALTMEAVAPVDRTPASPWPDQVERNPVDISPEQLKFIQDHGSSLLSESFYTRLFETAAGTLLPLIR